MIPLKQRPAREQAAAGVTIPFWTTDLDKPITYHLKLLILTPEELDRLVLIGRFHALRTKPSPTDNRNGNMFYPATDKERHSVLRHSCLNRTPGNMNTLAGYHGSYDAMLSKIERKGIDVVARQMQLRRHICALIDTYYGDPAYGNLPLESADYLWRYERKLGLI